MGLQLSLPAGSEVQYAQRMQQMKGDSIAKLQPNQGLAPNGRQRQVPGLNLNASSGYPARNPETVKSTQNKYQSSVALPNMNAAQQLDQRQFRSLNVDNSRSNGGLDIDFTFNTIKNVKKVQWKDEAPWYREINDGFCWLAYCNN